MCVCEFITVPHQHTQTSGKEHGSTYSVGTVRVFQSLTRCCMLGETRLSGMKRWTPPGQEMREGEGDRMSQYPERTRRRNSFGSSDTEKSILPSRYFGNGS